MLKRIIENNSKVVEDAEDWITDNEQNTAIASTSTAENSEPRRKRKRRSASVTEVRRSSRGHIPHSVEKDDYIWTVEEKQDLLNALKKYGHLDMDNLCKAVPQKSRPAIEAIIVKWWRRAAAMRENERENKPLNAGRLRKFQNKKKNQKKLVKKQTQPKNLLPIEQWIYQIRKAKSVSAYVETKSLAKAMLYISLFEKHPDPAECNGVDFSAIYDYLYRMLMGYPHKELNEATTKYLLGVIDKFIDKVRNGNFHSQIFHLKSVRKISIQPANVRTYSKSRKEEDQKPIVAESGWMKSLMEIPGFNPLGVGLELLKIE